MVAPKVWMDGRPKRVDGSMVVSAGSSMFRMAMSLLGIGGDDDDEEEEEDDDEERGRDRGSNKRAKGSASDADAAAAAADEEGKKKKKKKATAKKNKKGKKIKKSGSYDPLVAKLEDKVDELQVRIMRARHANHPLSPLLRSPLPIPLLRSLLRILLFSLLSAL